MCAEYDSDWMWEHYWRTKEREDAPNLLDPILEKEREGLPIHPTDFYWRGWSKLA